jgi:hypothetical protein
LAKSKRAAMNNIVEKTPKEYANELFSRAYILLFNSDTDKGDEILVSLLAKNTAIMNVQHAKEILNLLYGINCEFGEIVQMLKYLDETIKEIEIL